MPSDTFAGVVGWLESRSSEYTCCGVETEWSEMMHRAARLLEAAGRECRAWRKRNAITDPRDYERALSDVVPFIAALDALAPEMKEVGR